MNKKERLKISEFLFSAEEDTVINTLKIVKKSGDAELFNVVLELLNLNTNEKIHGEIVDIINNVKDDKVVPIMINAIKQMRFSKSLHALVTGCWMSGLNYGKYIDIFTDVFINTDFITAFEAFTLIENIEPKNIPPEILEKSYKKLLLAQKEINSDKEQLTNELLNLFDEIK